MKIHIFTVSDDYEHDPGTGPRYCERSSSDLEKQLIEHGVIDEMDGCAVFYGMTYQGIVEVEDA